MIWLKGYFLKELFLSMHAHLCLEQQNNGNSGNSISVYTKL